MKSEPLVSIVILNWNGTDDTLHCLESVAQLDYNNYETIVVDNGSSEDISRLREIKKPKIILIEEPRNLGFTGGEISALENCSGEYILILNNDAIIDKGAIKEALNVFSKDSKIAAVGGRSYLLDDNGGKMGIFHYSHQRVDPITAEVCTYSKDDDSERDVSNVSGACVLIRKKAIDKVGYFDKRFFAYYEETDLFSRFRRAGLRIVFSPRVVIWHKMGASTRNKKYMYNYLNYKNQFFFAYKNFSKEYLRLFKRAYRVHVRRSFLIVARQLGRVKKDDLVYKARLNAYIQTIIARPWLWKARRQTLAINPAFNLNERLLRDNPIPVSILIDATKLSRKQEAILTRNLTSVQALQVKPAEIIVVSTKPLNSPKTESLVRFANIVDNGRNGVTPLDYFFMTSNNDLLVFSKSQEFLDHTLSKTELRVVEKELLVYYTSAKANETAAILGAKLRKQTVTPGFIKQKNHDTIAISKQTLVNHLAEHTAIDTVTRDVLTDTVGRSVAQCIHTETTNQSRYFGIAAGTLSLAYEQILQHEALWWCKYLLTKLHVWSVIVKVLRRLKPSPEPSTKYAKPALQQPIAIDKDLPIIFNTRDRYEPLDSMIQWLDKRGFTNIIFVDNDSTYPPLLTLFANPNYQLVSLGRNAMHKAPWESMAVRFFTKGRPYIVSDPDIIPDKDCPVDAIDHFAELLNKYPKYNKVGFGLRIDNLPESNKQRNDIVSWEKRFWDKTKTVEQNVYIAELDTTFALYRPHTWWFLSPSLRTGKPYVAIHEPWYQASDAPSEDFLYYKMRASREVSTWGMESLPKHHLRALKKEGFIDEIIDDEED